MTVFEMMIAFIFVSLVLSWKIKRETMLHIKTIRTYSSRFPQWYVAPAKWMRKLFQIKDRVIPRYFYFRLFFSLFCALFAPIVIFIALFAINFAQNILAISFCIFFGMLFIELIVFYVVVALLKK